MHKEEEGGEWKRRNIIAEEGGRGEWKRRLEEEVEEQAGRIGWIWKQDWWRKTVEERRRVERTGREIYRRKNCRRWMRRGGGRRRMTVEKDEGGIGGGL